MRKLNTLITWTIIAIWAVVVAIFFNLNNHEALYPHAHNPWQIEVRHDNYGKCFAFIMDQDTQKHMYVVSCQDTVLITREANDG